MAVKSVESSTTVDELCRLCSLPARSRVIAIDQGETSVFCCAGCRNVWRILVESGQLSGIDDPRNTPLYQQALAAGLLGANPSSIPSLLNPGIAAPITVERKGGSLDDNRQCVLQIGGMWCSSCSWLIEQALARRRGVVSVEVSFFSDTASIIYKPARTDETVLAKTVKDLGYIASPLGEGNDNDPRVLARKRELLRIVICLVFAMNAMMTQLILYAGFFEGMSRTVRSGVPWLLLVLSIPVFVTAYPVFLRAYKAAEQGASTMDTLIGLGAGSALAYSIWQTIAGTGHVYYDTADMLLGLVMVGKFIESGARQSANDALSLLYGLLPKKAVILKDNAQLAVAISQIGEGDHVLVRAGERIAADGTVVDGLGTVDESLLSGESRPVNKRIGDHAIGGTILMNGVLTVDVEHVGSSGTLNQIIKHVEEAIRSKTPAEQLADRVSRIFVPVVLALAISTALVMAFLFHSTADEIMTRAVAVLVIACPCALGIATPMAISAGIASAARAGVLISDGGVFDQLRQVTEIVLDKTGTATEATFNVVRSIGMSEKTNLLVALESRSSHPIASALLSAYGNQNSPIIEVSDYVLDEGEGVSATVEGQAVFAGNISAVRRSGLTPTPEQATFAEECSRDGMTVIYWGIRDEHILGVAALGDSVRSGAIEAVALLKQLGITTRLVSGDSSAATAYIANLLSIEHYSGGATPAVKSEIIDGLRASGRKVCMVGDGVNDAPALARADVGVALASGTDIASRTAQATLLTPELQLLPRLVKLSRATVTIMRLNLFWALIYNAVCIPLAIFGYVTPLWAVSAMLLSSLTVVLNTQRVGRL